MPVATVDRVMRVTFLSVSAEMGGSEVSLLELLRGLRRLVPSWHLDLVVPREGALAAAARACGAGVHILRMPSRLARLGEAAGRGPVETAGRMVSLAMGCTPTGSSSMFSAHVSRRGTSRWCGTCTSTSDAGR
jgi:hypothetical protein